MQTQEATATPSDFLFKLWPWFEANKVRLASLVVAVLVFAGVYSFISWRHQQAEITAGEALTQLSLTPPATGGATLATAFEQLAAQYPGTQAAIRAQLQAAATLFDAGSYADAQTQFQKFVDNNPASPMAATAQLGVGASLEAQGKLDLAATAYQKVVAGFSASMSAIPANFALGRIAEQQGKLDEAVNHYSDVARLGQMGGTLAQQAGQLAYEIKAKMAAAQPAATAPAVTTVPPTSVPLLK